MHIELTEREFNRLRDIITEQQGQIKRYRSATLDMHEGLHQMYNAIDRDLRTLARKLDAQQTASSEGVSNVIQF